MLKFGRFLARIPLRNFIDYSKVEYPLNSEFYVNLKSNSLTNEQVVESIIENDLVFLDRDVAIINKRIEFTNQKLDLKLLSTRLNEMIPCGEEDFTVSSYLYPRFPSGLVAFSRNKISLVKLRGYYLSLEKNKSSFHMNYLCLCWGVPGSFNKEIDRFLVSYFNLDKHLNDIQGFLYKVPDGMRSINKVKRGEQVTKFIGHETLGRSDKFEKAFLINVKTKSTMRNLMELYLVHQGTHLIGEFNQSSRLIQDGKSTILLPPLKMRTDSPLSQELAIALGDSSLKRDDLSLMKHSKSLPIPGLSLKHDNFYMRQGAEYEESIDKKGKFKGLIFHSDLPDHFKTIMKQLGISLGK